MFRLKRGPRTTQPRGAAQYAPQWRGRALTGLLAGQTIATDGSPVTTVGTVTRSAYGGGVVSGGLASVHSSSIHRAVIAGSTLGTGTVGASLLVVFRTTTTGAGVYLAGLGSESGGSGNTIFSLWTGGGSAAELQGIFGGSTGNGVLTSSGASINDGRVHCAMLTLSDFSGGAGRTRLYLDGVRVAGDSGATAGNANLYSTVVSGGFRRGGSDFQNGDVQVLLAQPILGEVLEPESLSLTRNPWQLFAPEPRRIWVPSAGGGASSAALDTTGATGTFSGTAQTTPTATLAATGGTGTFAGTANSVSTAAAAISGGTGTFAGTANSPAVAALAVTGGIGAFSGTANSTTTAALAATGDTGTFAGSAGNGTSASLAATGDSGVFSGTASSPATATLAATGQSGTFSGEATTVGTASLAATGSSGTFSGDAVSISSAYLAALGDSGVFSGSASVAAPSAIGRPASDASNSGWTASTGSDLYAMLDEVTPDAGDYIVATGVGAICELALNATIYPGTAAQTLKFRASSSTGNSVIVRLKNTGGATVRSETQALTATDTEYSITLTAGEIAAITSGALSVELESA